MVAQSATSFGSMTNHPLFEDTYWGGMQYDPTNDLYDFPSIFQNRNTFFHDKKLWRHCSYTKELSAIKLLQRLDIPIPDHHITKDGFDHLEFYETTDGKLCIISSPYDTTDEIKNQMLDYNFVEYLPLYGYGTVTYLCLIDMSLYKNNNKYQLIKIMHEMCKDSHPYIVHNEYKLPKINSKIEAFKMIVECHKDTIFN